MNLKQRGYEFEIWKPEVGANGAQTCTGLQTKPLRSTPYSAVNANFLKFGGIFRYGTHVALMQSTRAHEAKRMGR